MDFGEPTKFAHAQKLAAAVGFIGLAGHDRVQPLAIGSRDLRPGRPLRGRASSRALSDWIAARSPDGTQGLAQGLSRLTVLRPGLFFLFTDGLDPQAADALRAISARGHELVLVQTLSPVELHPDLEGDLRLMDAETGEAVDITAHAQTLREYRQNLDAHCRRLEETILRGGGRWLQSVVGQTLPGFVTDGLRRTGLVE